MSIQGPAITSVTSTAISFVVGLLIGESRDPARRRAILSAGVALHLTILGIFKYLDFLVGSANQLAHLLGLQHELPFVEILLPVGISFFTFHGISYITDVYRGDVAVCRAPLDMALYMSFFPQLVSGPIVRAAYFLPQLARPSDEPIPIAAALSTPLPARTRWSTGCPTSTSCRSTSAPD